MPLIPKSSSIGAYSFLAGILLSIGLVYFANPIIALFVFASAIIVGLSNVQKAEEMKLLLAIVGIGVVGFVTFSNSAALVPMMGTFLSSAVGAIGGYFTLVSSVVLVVVLWRTYSK